METRILYQASGIPFSKQTSSTCAQLPCKKYQGNDLRLTFQISRDSPSKITKNPLEEDITTEEFNSRFCLIFFVVNQSAYENDSEERVF
mmetsp:Transcript_38772/g.51092  ORF Transcript_38772/g.51092 Transcript_38772/m.51092 type:complete len:89 (-) Transcript_38772:153-419(-)